MVFHYQKLRSFDNGKSLEVEIDDNSDSFWRHDQKVLFSMLESAERSGSIKFRMGGAYCCEVVSYPETAIKTMPTFQI